MKKLRLILIPAIVLIFAACSKSNTNVSATVTPEGKWVGTGQYGTGPTYAFTITFKANGTVDIIGDNTVGIDNAVGTWQKVQDSVKATYKYAASSAQYTLAAKYATNANVMAGTIGLSPATTGTGTFSVTKQ